eukprot:c23889_g2_i1 orf=481-1056(+)
MLGLRRPENKKLRPLGSSTELENGVFWVWKMGFRKNPGTARGVHCRAQQEEEEEEEVMEMCIAGSAKHHSDVNGSVSVVSLLKDCAKKKDLHRGSRIHADIVTRRLLEKDIFVGSTLVNMYAKCGALSKAQEVFDELPFQNVVAWNSLIAGYVQHGHAEEALQKSGLMQRQGLSPDAFTYTFILKACGSIR